MKHLNIKTVGCFDTLLNNRLLLKGITFAKMYDTFRQKPSSGYWTKKNMGKDVSNEIVEFSGLEDTEISLLTKDAVVKKFVL